MNLLRSHAPKLIKLVPHVNFFNPPIADLTPVLRDLRELEGELLTMSQSPSDTPQLNNPASGSDKQRRDFAEPLLAKRIRYKKIVVMWKQETGEPCDELAMKQSVYRARKAEKQGEKR